MAELSPQAQAVLDAAYRRMDDNPFNEVEATLAAALRAAVAHTQQHYNHDVWKCDADELFAIAAELEQLSD